jgi:hypothetical protein
MWRRSAWVAGAVADIGRLRPRASMRQAMVLAVPMTPQVPTDGQRWPLMSSVSDASMLPARCYVQKRRQSVQAPEDFAFVVADEAWGRFSSEY